MNKVFWLLPNQLAGRPGPIDEPWFLQEFKAQGIAVIINLTNLEPDYPALEKVGISPGWSPLPDDYPANKQTEFECEQVVPSAYKFLREAMMGNRRVLVHCAWGQDRLFASACPKGRWLRIIPKPSPRAANSVLHRLWLGCSGCSRILGCVRQRVFPK